MIAGYANSPGYGNTPWGGVKGFSIFEKGKDLENEKHLTGIDALILWGGADIGTILYNQKPVNNPSFGYEPSRRDLYEWELLRRCSKKGIPIVGVCRGAQLMCAFAGGKLVQHVSGHQSGSHGVVTDTGEIFETSSCHHQMMFPYDIEHKILARVVKNLSNDYDGLSAEEAEAFTHDSVFEPEVVLFPEINGIGVQGHPEWHSSIKEMAFNDWFEKQIISYLYGESV